MTSLIVNIKPLAQFDDRTVGTLLRGSRKFAGFSLRQLAERTGVPRSAISAYEKGQRSPSLSILSKLLVECGVDLELHFARRIRHRDGLDRGEELEQVLALAEQFPATHDWELKLPKLADIIGVLK